MTSFLRWTNADLDAFGDYTNPTDPSYPYRTIEWSSTNAGKYGVGVLQTPIPNRTSTCSANFFYLPAYQNIVQWLLVNDAGIATFPLVNDGGGYTPSTTGDVTLPSLLIYMLSPATDPTGAPAIPWTNWTGRFDPSRVWCIQPTVRLLPFVSGLCGSGGSSNPFFGYYTVIPPYGYANMGAYFVGWNVGNNKYLYPNSQLQFIVKDPRFCQPAANGYVELQQYQSAIIWTANSFAATVTQSVVGSSSTASFKYNFLPLGGAITWPGFVSGNYTMSSYSNDFPWAPNTQLVRVFPNGPEAAFSNINFERWYWGSTSGCGQKQQLVLYAGNPLQHPCLLSPSIGTSTFPVVVYWGLQYLLGCCTTQANFTDFTWNIQAYPLPEGVTSDMSFMQALCLAGSQGSFKYVPGTDCDLATSAYCNSTRSAYSTDTCSCYNSDAMLATVGLYPVPSDPSEAQLAETLVANITCVYTTCQEAGSFKSSTAPGVAPGLACPDLQNCIISGTSDTGGNIGKLENNCSASSGGTAVPLSSLTAAQWIMIAAAIFFVVIVFLLLIERHNRKKMTKSLKKDNEREKGSEDYDGDYDRDADKEVSHHGSPS